MSRLFRCFSVEMTVKRIISAFCSANIVLLLINSFHFSDLKFVSSSSLLYTIVYTICFFILYTSLYMFVYEKISKLDSYIMLGSVTLYLFLCLTQERDLYFCLMCLALVLMALYFTVIKDKIILPKLNEKTAKIIMFVCIAIVFFLTGIVIGLRYLTFATPCFDFGIFTQMFDNMKDTLLPTTTCERYQFLSHFSVHFSPAYYLLLPIYMIFPNPFTLELLQGAVLAVGVIPLYLLCKHFKLSPKITIAFMITYAFYPALLGGCTYDLHENMFLTTFLLWLFYFIEKNKLWGIITFTLLTLTVKEDAAVYIAIIGLFVILSKKKWKIGTFMTAIAVAYFLFTCWYLTTFGLGIMAGRYSNFMYDNNGSLLSVIKAVLLDPALAVYESLDEEKFVFLIQMLVPLGFTSVMSKKFSRFILLIPFILINLMSDYVYQHSINFQYVFGVIAILFYLSIVNVSEMKYNTKRLVMPFCVIASIMMFTTTMSGELQYINRFIVNYEENQLMFRELEQLPTDKSISATTFLVPALYEQDELYQTNETKQPETDIIVIDKRYSINYDIIDAYVKKGYVQVDNYYKESEEQICILYSPQLQQLQNN